MAIHKLTTDGSYYVTALMWDHDGLPSHRRSFIRGRAGLHDLLKMRRQVNKRACGCQLSLVSIDLELNIIVIVDTGAL